MSNSVDKSMHEVLAVELILYVFEFATRTGESDDWKRLLTLSHVSRRWRSILLDNASMWRQISVPIGIHREMSWVACNVWIQRSKSSLIDISLRVTSDGHVFDPSDDEAHQVCECNIPRKTMKKLVRLIKRHIHRCSSLLLDYIHVDDAQEVVANLAMLPMQPRLRNFSLGVLGSRSKHKTPSCPLTIFGGSWSNIRNLRLYNARHFIIPEFRNLTSLHWAPRDWTIHGVTVPSFFLILEHNPLIERLDVAGLTSIVPARQGHEFTGQPYLMRRLKRLYLWFRSFHSLTVVMGHISLPGIELLGLTVDYREDEPPEGLKLYGVDASPDNAPVSHSPESIFPHNIKYPGAVVPFLDPRYPNLHSIDLGNSPLKLLYDILVRSPKLENIAIDNGMQQFTTSELSDLLVSSFGNIIPLRRLQLKDFFMITDWQILRIAKHYTEDRACDAPISQRPQRRKLDLLEFKRCSFDRELPLDIPVLLNYFCRVQTSKEIIVCPKRLQLPFDFEVIPMYDRWEVTGLVSHGDNI
ncbi:uncharacterized protein EI90DRAFT_3074117 [Cantharellus anzutake]|uniref:uncharacterized protein n=1 Tax=Cantharellus anzutake TaxID=1750568 RepID=UPI0019081C27|nr:uncharacterized protein EI90DRAFT_3074117 [Cantharellus anzutake]KAF8324852.1 hypothetical protein EI90DRAFT_3074117 [Cantharellus anzutake]